MDQFFQAWAVQIVIPIIRGEAIQQMVEVLGANLTVEELSHSKDPTGRRDRGPNQAVDLKEARLNPVWIAIQASSQVDLAWRTIPIPRADLEAPGRF